MTVKITPNEARRQALRRKAIDGQALKRLVEVALTWLRTNQEVVNALNVFPVPDGDTGTNMTLTMQAAWDEIKDSPEEHFGQMCQKVAHGALMGARGNSGVILSQLWRGFARAVAEMPTLSAEGLVRGLVLARDTAYKGVVRPVEGTILTVSKDIAHAAEEAFRQTNDLITLLEVVVQAADASVARTPELLPVLKEAGVVDSGGKGLFFILEGMLRYVDGQPLDKALTSVRPLASLNLEHAHDAVEPGQDYEVVLDFRPHQPLDLEAFYQTLEEMGTSIQVGEGEGLYRLHIHVPTENRYRPIDYAMSLGTVTRVQIENLIAQMEEQSSGTEGTRYELANVEPDQIAVVAVAPGPGIARVFASLGAAAIVEGGQTMNPSTQDILRAFENLPTDKIIILPNNKNVTLAAQQAQEVTVKQVQVIPSRTVPQGLAAMLAFDPDGALDEVAAAMQEAMGEVISGEITMATRTVAIDGVAVQEGEYIALLDGRLILAASSLEEAVLGLLKQAEAEAYELITMFYGDGLSKSRAHRLADLVREAYPDQEIEVQFGGQPHYPLILAVE